MTQEEEQQKIEEAKALTEWIVWASGRIRHLEYNINRIKSYAETDMSNPPLKEEVLEIISLIKP